MKNVSFKIGLHKSAYNLRSGENYKYQEVEWNRTKEEIIQKLNPTNSYQRAWVEDDSK